MNLLNQLKKLSGKHTVILTVLAAAVLVYFINSYSTNKGAIKSAMSSNQVKVAPSGLPGVPSLGDRRGENCSSSNARPAEPLGQNSGPATAKGIHTSDHGLPPSCTKKAVVDPRNLLPRDANNQFSKMNPSGAGDVMNVSLLKAGYHAGINTVGQSLRNANLQLRSEPANPQLQVGPWNTSTISPDNNRRPLEIGCGSSN